ncbi:hypothetical protein EMPS_07870 [Entomortierella parvispora]|uniref:DNA replication checkpoint mediator MRC1 domain-containing protein n=1 Tax=Entomortierella parvispora TaxID=205924 RepID=A0A9P3HFR9_9FUNG|nr:hypothetical protein EMPS_07870 [Entomortierella parvispora]
MCLPFNNHMAEGMDKGLMALMGIEDESVNPQSPASSSQSASGFLVGSPISDTDEDSLIMEQSSSILSPQIPTKSRQNQLNPASVPNLPESNPVAGSQSPSHLKSLRASSSSLFMRESPEQVMNSGPQERKLTQRTKDKSLEPSSFMFSPTLKPKRNASKPRLHHNIENTRQDMTPNDIRPSSLSPHHFVDSPSPGEQRDPLSPSSVRSRPGFHSDNQSDSEEGVSYSSAGDHHNSLHSSCASDGIFNADVTTNGLGSAPISSALAGSSITTSLVGEHAWDRGSDQHAHEPRATPKAIRLSKKQHLEETKERERLLRIGGTNLKSAVNRKLTIQSLMKETLAKQQSKEGKTCRGLVSLSSSEDEEEMSGKWEQGRWKSRAITGMRIPNASNVSDQLERVKDPESVIASPLSNQIRNLSLLGSSSQGLNDSLFAAKSVMMSPPKKRVASNINNFNSQMKREMSKRNLQRHNIQKHDTEKPGKWRSTSDYMVNNSDREMTKICGSGLDEVEAREDILVSSLTEDNAYEFDGEKDTDTGSENEALSADSEGRNLLTESEEEKNSASETDDSDQDSEETKPVKIKRITSRKLNVIGDDDSDVRVVLVDHRQAHDSLTDSGSEGPLDGPHDVDDCNIRTDDDDDISDLDKPTGEPNYPRTPRVRVISGTGSTLASPTRLSPSTDTIANGLSQTDEKESVEVLSSALDFLSGRFPIARSSSEELTPLRQETNDKSSPPTLSFSQIEARNMHNFGKRGDGDAKKGSQSALGTSKQEQHGRRLIKQEPKHTISKGDKSAFIEYEAEEEEDEFMGMGGVDYESDNPENDDYDLGDDMIDSNIDLGSRDAENVRKLHMQQEQDQHNKDISDLVHGIAAGSLWKRRNGQMDDLDLFDDEDMDGRFRRKKKLKISEKLEELADNPTTMAFARAFTKNVEDDQLVFLSDVDETDSERDSPNEDSIMSLRVSDEGVEDPAADRTRERFAESRLLIGRPIDNGSLKDLASGSLTAVTRSQVLPFEILNRDIGSTPTVAQEVADSKNELRQALRRNRIIRNIIDADDHDRPSMSLWSDSSAFNGQLPVKDASFLDDNVAAVADSITVDSRMQDATADATTETSVSVSATARSEKIAHQSLTFLPKDRKTHFLRTVGDESRRSTRVVKDVNRRRMAFAPSVNSESPQPDLD